MATAVRVVYCSNTVIMSSSDSVHRFFIRTNSSSESSHTTVLDKQVSSATGWWVGTPSTSLYANTAYAANVGTVSGDTTTWKLEPALTWQSSSTLKTLGESISASASANSVTISMSGWTRGYTGNSNWPNITIKLTRYSDGTQDGSATLSLGTWMSSGYTFTGLQYGTKYTITVSVTDPGTVLTNSKTVTTGSLSAPTISSFTVSQTSRGSTNISYSITAVCSQSVKCDMYWTYNGTTYYYPSSGYLTSSTTGTQTLSGTITGSNYSSLVLGNTYTVYVRVFNSADTSKYTSSYKSVTLSLGTPAVWSWTSANKTETYGVYKYNSSDTWTWTTSAAATTTNTSNAKSVLDNKTAVSNFSHLVWNDLCAKVMECISCAGGSWDSTYATYANTQMTSSSKTLTATRYNSLLYNIRKYSTSYTGSGYASGTAISGTWGVASGDTVYASYFTNLATAINYWINNKL